VQTDLRISLAFVFLPTRGEQGERGELTRIGFPKMIVALNWAHEVLSEAEDKDKKRDEDEYERFRLCLE